ncbi:MAG TPA: MarR family transcriptional regulator [Methylophilaceae bacterium]
MINSKADTLETLRLFRIIFKSITKHYNEIEKSSGVGGASLWAMAEIADSNNLTVSGLAKAMSIHQSTTSNLLEKLESKRYVTRIRSTDDRRVVHLSLTAKGREALAKAPVPYRGLLPDAVMRLEPNTMMQLNHNLTELVAKLEWKQEGDAFKPLGNL